MEAVKGDLKAEAYDADTRVRATPTVASAFIQFRGLLHDVGLSPHADEVFSVKVEIDTNPPAGAVTTTKIVRRFGMSPRFLKERRMWRSFRSPPCGPCWRDTRGPVPAPGITPSHHK
jgi:hypothetical protein